MTLLQKPNFMIKVVTFVKFKISLHFHFLNEEKDAILQNLPFFQIILDYFRKICDSSMT